MRGRTPSLLYTAEQAAEVDREILNSLGTSALIELDVLAEGAAAFSSFERDLVGTGAAGSLSGPRALLTPPDVERLDAMLDQLLAALRPHVLHRAGLKLLEFLLQVHEVHRHRPLSLLLTVLPYHSTPAYGKLAPLVFPHLPGSSPLAKLQPRPTPRSALVAAAHSASSTAVLSSGTISRLGDKGAPAAITDGTMSTVCCHDLMGIASAASAEAGGKGGERSGNSHGGGRGSSLARQVGGLDGVHTSFEVVLMLESLPKMIASGHEERLLPILQVCTTAH